MGPGCSGWQLLNLRRLYPVVQETGSHFLVSHSSLNHSRPEHCEHTVVFGVAWQVKGYSFRNRQCQGNSLQETWGNSNLVIKYLCSVTTMQEAVFLF